MIYTASFWRCLHSPHAISIARRSPHDFGGPSYEPLMPTWKELNTYRATLKTQGEDAAMRQFNEHFMAKLQRLDVKRVLSDLPDGSVLCCWEHDAAKCHRSLVRTWLRANGAQCDEIACHQPTNPGRPQQPSQLDLFAE